MPTPRQLRQFAPNPLRRGNNSSRPNRAPQPHSDSCTHLVVDDFMEKIDFATISRKQIFTVSDWRGFQRRGKASPPFPLKVDVHGLHGSVHAMNFGRYQNIGRIQCFGGEQHRARVTSYQSNARLGPELLNEGEVGMPESSIRLGPREQQIAELAAPGLRQFRNCPATQDGQAHGEGAL